MAYGGFEPLFEDAEGLMAYSRRADRELIVLANLKEESQAVPLQDFGGVLLNNSDELTIADDMIILKGWQGVIYERI